MAQNQALINQINTKMTGANGISFAAPGSASGGAAPAESELLSNDNFTDPASVNLEPEVMGGNGGTGVIGADGAGSVAIKTVNGGVTTDTFPGGQNGGPGGNGGSGGSASLDIEGFTIGSTTTVNSGFGIVAVATGGTGAAAKGGGGGGGATITSR
jgi:hypothetical protein